MLMINFIRAMIILASIGLYHIYNKDFLTMDQGVVVFVLSFVGLILIEILQDYTIRMFNPEDQKDPSSETFR